VDYDFVNDIGNNDMGGDWVFDFDAHASTIHFHGNRYITINTAFAKINCLKRCYIYSAVVI